jgi:hypothetical protein
VTSPEPGPALARLATYRRARERLHEDVRAADAEGASQADIARESGLTRQWVAQILAGHPRKETQR